MNFKFKAIFGFFLFLVTFFVIVKPASAFAFTLSGNVSNSSNAVISGASVDVKDLLNNEVGNAVTDSLGNYSISNINNGTYNVFLTPPTGSNYTPVAASNYQINGNSTLNFVLVLAGSVSLSGHVYDGAGNPLANLTAKIFNSAGLQVATTTTDSNGSYSFQVASGDYGVSIEGGNNDTSIPVPQTFNVGFSASLTQSEVVNITLPVKKVVVHVQDSNANALTGVNVNAGDSVNFDSTNNVRQLTLGSGITNGSGISNYTSASSPVTDSSGNVTLWLFPNDSIRYYTFVANPSANSIYLTTDLTNIKITSDTNLTITMKQPVTITGHVYDGTGVAMAGQTVTLTPPNGNPLPSVTTDSSGNYSFQIAPDTYGIQIQGSSNGSIEAPQNYSLGFPYTISQNTNLDITLPVKKVVVHIQDSHANPLSGVNVNAGDSVNFDSANNVRQLVLSNGVTNASGKSSYDSTSSPVTDSSGNATLWLFPNDSIRYYTFVANPPSNTNFQTTSVTNIKITSDTNLSITMNQPITIRGHLFDGTGTPFSGQQVQIMDQTGTILNTVTTDNTGAYSFTESPGTYSIIFSGVNNNPTIEAPQNYSLSFASNFSQNTDDEITLPVKKVSIHVQDALSNSVSGVNINAGDSINFEQANNVRQLVLSNGITNASGKSSYDTPSYPVTDSSGNVTLWLFPNDAFKNYDFIATSTNSSAFLPFTLQNIHITSDLTELISLQYSHAAPISTINLQTQQQDGTYTNPTTITVSATATSGYTVANTYYTIDGGAQQTYIAPFTVTGTGSHTITYWSVDNSGVQEIHNSKTFTIAASFTLSGTVYFDKNQNGVQDPGETGYSGATVTLNTGQTTTTDSNGNYSFSNLQAGSYTETLTVPTGYFATTTDPVNVTISANTTQNFGISHTAPTTTATLSPASFSDGTYHDPTTVTLSGAAEAGFSIANTYYTLDGGAQQTYSSPFTVTGAGSHTVTYWSVDNSGLSETPNTKTFAITEVYNLTGTVYNDDNQNGFQDPQELGYQGATVTLSNGSSSQTATTDANGNYTFSSLFAGSYTETLTIPNGYSATTADPVSLPISANTTQNFGMYSKPAVQAVTVTPNPVQIATAVLATTTFTDADPTDTHTAKVDWGDQTGLHDCTVTESTKSVSCSLPSGYTAANIYAVTIYVYDNDGAQGQATNPNVSVYAPTPSGKFSAGNGYVTPTNAIAQNPAVLTSTVSFGLVYKYNGTMPTGDKQFTMTFGQSGASTTTFSASSVTSLVLSNGTGTLTGTGTFSTSNTVYNFLVTGNQNTNTIRIKITDPNTNTVIYDTQQGASDTAAPTTPVTGPNGKGNGHVIVG